MGISDLLQNLKDKFKEANTPEKLYEDHETRDKYLRSLRREKRTQLEEIEKQRLQKEIANYKKERVKKELYGIKEKVRKTKGLLGKVNNKIKRGWY